MLDSGRYALICELHERWMATNRTDKFEEYAERNEVTSEEFKDWDKRYFGESTWHRFFDNIPGL